MNFTRKVLATAVVFVGMSAVALPSFAAKVVLRMPAPSTASHVDGDGDVVLTPAVLSTGRVGEPYASFDFAPLLQVKDGAGSPGSIAWSIAGDLPPGMTFSDGVLAGTPSASTPRNGVRLIVTATFGGKSGSANYVLNVASNCDAAPTEIRTETLGPVAIPKNCTTVRIKAWGSPGSYGWTSSPNDMFVGEGGGGGYAAGTFRLSPSDTLLVSVSSTHAPTPDNAHPYGGPGGDAVFVADGTYAPLVVAGGGGGGSPLTMTTGAAGYAGGAGGPLGSGPDGEWGSSVIDPDNPYFRAGGGGGGYPRGGAAATLTSGAGGGQSYVSPRAQDVEIVAGSGVRPGNIRDPDNQQAGLACPTGCHMGAVVLIWSE